MANIGQIVRELADSVIVAREDGTPDEQATADLAGWLRELAAMDDAALAERYA